MRRGMLVALALAGTGDDLLTGGAGRDTLDGGDGRDRVSFLGGPAVTVDLADPGPDGPASEQDGLQSIEEVIGSEEADTLRGDGGADLLEGGVSTRPRSTRGGAQRPQRRTAPALLDTAALRPATGLPCPRSSTSNARASRRAPRSGSPSRAPRWLG
jgi:hypothetical protein